MSETTRRKKRIDRGVKVRANTIYGVSSFKELTYLLAPRLALILGILILPLIAPNLYWNKVLCITGVFALLAVGLDFLLNFAGLLCLGMAFFVGVGGYISGLLNVTFGLPVYLCIIIGTFGGAFFCTLAYLPCLPLRGIYFAVVSFMYPLVFGKFVVAVGLFGGTDGVTGLDILTNIWVNQYVLLGVPLLCVFALRRLVNENIGIVLRGIKDNDQTIIASGINITYYKTMALFITAVMGCFAGAYLSHLYGWVGTSQFALDFSIFPLAAIVVGGAGTIAGPLIATAILAPVSEMLRTFSGLRILFYSLAILLCIIFWSEGFLNWARKKYEQYQIWVKV
ncbi:MAG: branched-chain amino acid ABC transporter permease [Pseudomonadota bacterium]